MSEIANTHILAAPVTIKNIVDGSLVEEAITSITLKSEIKAKDLRVTDAVQGDVAKSIALIAKLSGHPVAVIDELEIADFTALAEILGKFIPDGLLTGQTA